MLFSWQVLMVISVMAYSLTVLLQRIILRAAVRPIAYAIFSQLICAVFLGALGLLTGQLRPNMLYPSVLQPVGWSLVALGSLYGLGNVLVSRALQITEASKFTVLFAA